MKDPKEIAKRLVLLFIDVPDNAMPPDSNRAWIDKILAKECAVTCVNEILEALPDAKMYNIPLADYDDLWIQVKKEIPNI